MIVFHLVGPSHEDGLEAENVLEDVIELKEVLGGLLGVIIHSKKNGLVHKSRVGITENGHEDFVSIRSGGSALRRCGLEGECTGVLKNTANVIFSGGVFSEFGFEKIDSKFKASGSAMCLG
jgi:hypothetical protein